MSPDSARRARAAFRPPATIRFSGDSTPVTPSGRGSGALLPTTATRCAGVSCTATDSRSSISSEVLDASTPALVAED